MIKVAFLVLLSASLALDASAKTKAMFFFDTEDYTYWLCDLHARYRPDGKQIAFNSVHEGTRQVYIRDVQEGR